MIPLTDPMVQKYLKPTLKIILLPRIEFSGATIRPNQGRSQFYLLRRTHENYLIVGIKISNRQRFAHPILLEQWRKLAVNQLLSQGHINLVRLFDSGAKFGKNFVANNTGIQSQFVW